MVEWNEELEHAVARLARLALDEDHATKDATTHVCIPPGRRCRGVISSRKRTVLAGVHVPNIVLRCFDANYNIMAHASDGQLVDEGETCVEISGDAAAILSCERTILNIMQHLCGIATLTRQFVDAVSEFGVQIVDTRKTTPGWRLLEKYAVRCGGGVNHRMHLADMVMIKDNHLALATDSLEILVRRARQRYPALPVACEATTLEQVEELLKLNVDVIMLDNMQPDQVRHAVQMCRGKACLEVTGGITLANVRSYAATGVQRISVGALTHSAPAADLSLDVFAV